MTLLRRTRPAAFLVLLVASGLLFGSTGWAFDSGGVNAVVDFDTQIAPIFSKHGCNAAACHGASGGRGGFQLSLFGSDSAFDFDQIARERRGRRLHRTKPELSLLLLKPTEEIDHEGGLHFAKNSPESKALQAWIEQGARRLVLRRLERIEVTPKSVVLASAETNVPITVRAFFETGEQFDVTSDALFSTADNGGLRLDANNATIDQPGQHSVLVRYLSKVALVNVTLPYADPIRADSLERNNFVDDAINHRLAELGLMSALRASDETLIRRVTLDLTGRLPSEEESQTYIADQHTDKYERLVDRLLHSAPFADLWTYHVSEWLRVGSPEQNENVATAYFEWVRNEIRGDASLSTLARESLTALGGIENGATGFYRLTNDAKIQAEQACRIWMGVRISCAQCHNHPLDKWKRDDYYGLSAVFAQVRRNASIELAPEGQIQHPVSGKEVKPTLPDGVLAESNDPRVDFANWLLSPDDAYFARSLANRIWASLMGIGVYEPIDDYRETNPVSNVELLNALAKNLAENEFRLRPLIRSVVTSAAYCRSITDAPRMSQDQFYWRAMERPLPPPVLLDAIEQITRLEPGDADLRHIRQARPMADQELIVFGQCDRSVGCAMGPNGSASTASLATALHLINGGLLNERVTRDRGWLTLQFAKNASDNEMLDRLYWHAYSRAPRDTEREFWLTELSADSTGSNRNNLWQDFFWSILGSREFITNH